MIANFSYLICDGDYGDHLCGWPSPLEDTAKEARQTAQACGWVRRNGKDLCPSCKERDAA